MVVRCESSSGQLIPSTGNPWNEAVCGMILLSWLLLPSLGYKYTTKEEAWIPADSRADAGHQPSHPDGGCGEGGSLCWSAEGGAA